MLNFTRLMLKRLFALGLSLVALASTSAAQASADSEVTGLSTTPLIQSLHDSRFAGVTEDLSTPSLATSNLKPVRPLRNLDRTHPGYTVETIRLQWRWDDPIDLYVMRPKGVEKPPVILYLFGFPQDTDLFTNPDFQNEVTKGGFAAVCFVPALTGQRYHDRPMKEWFISELQESLGESAHDVQMILNFLAARGDFDMNRVGMFGLKSGGTIAILASAVDPRIKVLDVVDPWGDWPTWMANSPFIPQEERPNYVTPDFLKKASTLDPVDWLPKIQAKKFRFQDAVFEPVTPAKSKEKLRAAAPSGTTFVFYKTDQEFEAAFPENSLDTQWIRHELNVLPGLSTMASTTAPSPAESSSYKK